MALAEKPGEAAADTARTQCISTRSTCTHRQADAADQAELRQAATTTPTANFEGNECKRWGVGYSEGDLAELGRPRQHDVVHHLGDVAAKVARHTSTRQRQRVETSAGDEAPRRATRPRISTLR